MVRHRGLNNPRPSIVEGFDPPEATMVRHLSQGGWLVCRDGPGPGLGPARMSYLPGSIRLAWVYESRVGLQVWRGSINLAWVSKSSVGLQV